jgi:hypothetical protein
LVASLSSTGYIRWQRTFVSILRLEAENPFL